MYKFFEPGSRIMVLRPDITMPIARIAATKMKAYSLPPRLSYIEAFTGMITKAAPGRGRLSSRHRITGSRKPEADAEVIALAVESLLGLGLRISDGYRSGGLFKGLVEQAGLNEEQSEGLRRLIDQKQSGPGNAVKGIKHKR